MTHPTYPVTIRGHDGNPDRTLELLRGDFSALQQIATQRLEIKQCERAFRRLQTRRLARHVFETDTDGFPRAYAQLTGDGEQALTQAPFTVGAA